MTASRVAGAASPRLAMIRTRRNRLRTVSVASLVGTLIRVGQAGSFEKNGITAVAKAKSVSLRDVGWCIYCTDYERRIYEGNLHEEHIVAANLGGDYTLEHASCVPHEALINKEIETPFMQIMYKDIRYKKRIGSRRLKNRPQTLSIRTNKSFADGITREYINTVSWDKKELPYEDHPTFFSLPIMNAPGLVLGLNPNEPDANLPYGLWVYAERPSDDMFDREGGVYLEHDYKHGIFMRLLAKTAHCAVVARHGLEAFEPFLLDIITKNDTSKTGYYIGGTANDPFATIENSGAKDYQLADDSFRHYGNSILFGCFIKLFANLRSPLNGTRPPTYRVIVGKKR
jgi:hypothetical protein